VSGPGAVEVLAALSSDIAMKKLVPGLTCLLLGITAQSAAPPGTLVGMRVPPYPQDMQESSGGCADSICSRAIGVVALKGVPAKIVALRLVERKAGKPVWQVTDEVAYPHTERGEFVGVCFEAGAALMDTYAIVSDKEDGEKPLPRRWAVRLDPATGRLLKPDLAKFRCTAPVGED
jgi:hypothetical protein